MLQSFVLHLSSLHLLFCVLCLSSSSLTGRGLVIWSGVPGVCCLLIWCFSCMYAEPQAGEILSACYSELNTICFNDAKYKGRFVIGIV